MEKDEEKILSRRRLEKWLKIFLAFLAFVWLCTIISKSIYVSGLTRVRTDTVSKKYVEHIVEADGIVLTGGEIAVNTQSGLRVDRIYVRQGDAVRAGDVLFTIDLADIAGMISAKETELAKQQCSLSDLQVNAVIDLQKREVALLWAQEDYETADKETAVAKERAKEALDKAEAELGKHLADMAPYTPDSTRRDAWDDYHDWVNKGYGISDRITAKEREIQDLEEQLGELEKQDNSTGTTDHGTDSKVLSGAAGDTGADSEGSPDHKEDAEEDDKDDINSGGDTETGADNGTDTNDDSDQGGGDDTNAADRDDTGPDGEDGAADQDEPKPADQDDTGSSQDPGNGAEKLELQNQIKKARADLLALQDELTKHDRETVSQPDYSAEELQYDEWQNTKLALEADVQSAKEHYNDVSYAREVTLRQKQRDIASAQVTAMADSTAAVYELDLQQTRTQLASLYAIQKQKGEIRAQEDGVVSAVRVEAGGRTQDTAAVLMTDKERPCQFKFSITKEQGKYVHLNDTVELKLNGQSAEMEVTVDYFTENAQGGYDAVCMLPEDLGQPGLSGSIRKTVQGEYHNLTLPADAVFEDQGGSHYVFVLNEKEGILGSEYYVEKIRVQVKDQNDRFAALEAGAISTDTKVVVYSTEELKQGESVRPDGT